MVAISCVILIAYFAEINSQNVRRSDVSFHFYSKQTGREAVLLTEENFTNILGSKPNKVIFHGWTEKWQVPWYNALAQAYLYKGDFNIIAIDYSGPVSSPYFTAVQLAPQIGVIIATAIITFKLDLSQTHFIGHSLGAHIAGFSAKSIYEKTRKKVDRITGLDPAGPAFTLASETNRLSKADANFVDIIHTNDYFLGLGKSIGNADFYPNGGQLQPGCANINVTLPDLLANASNYLSSEEAQTYPYAEVTLYRYYSRNKVGPTLLDPTNLTLYVDNTKPVKILLHGYTESGETEWYLLLIEAYLEREDYHSIAVDYHELVSLDYFTAVSSAPAIGEFIGTTIVEAGIHPSKVHLIGHSLGAQIASYAGRKIKTLINQLVDRISGLDPAGPHYNSVSESERLSRNDGVFVDMIHTDCGGLGISFSCGTVDFYPNDGRSYQLGCANIGIDLFQSLINPISFMLNAGSCSHHRSVLLFAESIKSKLFIGKKCTMGVFGKTCNENDKMIMGEDVPRYAYGDYYLQTKSASPFAMY